MPATGFAIVLPAVASSGTLASTVKVYAWVPDSNGAPTATPFTLYTDANCSVAASNPATLGASVRKLYKPPGSACVIVVKSADDAITYDTIHFPVIDPTDATVVAFSALSFSGTNAFLRATASDTFVAESASAHRSAMQIGIGTTTNDNAASGYVGELATGTAASGSVSFTNATAASIISLSLSAGDWDVWFNAEFTPAATTTVNQLIASISTTNNTLYLSSYDGYGKFSYPSSYVPRAGIIVPAGPRRISIASTTIIYGVGYADFGTSTMSAGGTLRARRVR